MTEISIHKMDEFKHTIAQVINGLYIGNDDGHTGLQHGQIRFEFYDDGASAFLTDNKSSIHVDERDRSITVYGAKLLSNKDGEIKFSY